MKNIYFSQDFISNIDKKNIRLNFQKKMKKSEKFFLKFLFFKIISESSFLNDSRIMLNEVNQLLGLSDIMDFTLFCQNLSEKHILFNFSSENIEYSGSLALISSFIVDGECCRLFLTEEFKGCFSSKNNIFSILEIDKFIFMEDISSFRLYERIMNAPEKDSEIIFPISVLKNYLNSENKYSRFFDFEKHVLQKAVADINTFSSFNIKYRKIKSGARASNKIVSIAFTIEMRKEMLTGYDDTVNELISMVKSRIQNTEDIYALLNSYIKRRGYQYVYNNIEYLRNSSSDNFERKLKKALLFNLATNRLELFTDIDEVVESPVVLFYTLSRNINEIKLHYHKIEPLLDTSIEKDIKSINYFKDKDIFEFANEDIEIYVKYRSNKKSTIKIYLPEYIINKISDSRIRSEYPNKK